jgi:hypothetical protein
MVPVFEAKRFYLKENLHRVDYEGRMINITQSFIDDEYLPFPVALHDDLLDAIARIWDIETQWPMPSHSGRLRSGGMKSDYHPIDSWSNSWDRVRGGNRNVADGPYRPYGRE